MLLGRDDAKLRLQRFARLLPQLPAQDDRTLKRAGLRYTNGFALSWQGLTPEPTGPTHVQDKT